MIINIDEYELFSINRSNLKELSKDDSDINDIKYMTYSQIEAINFDEVKTKYANNLSLSYTVAKSFDGLAFWADDLTFIEFKNGKMKNEKTSIKHKIRDSLLIFCDIIGRNITFTREKVTFILVYNEEKNPYPNQSKEFQNTKSRVKIAEHFLNKADEELIRFDLEKFKKLYFRSVHTYTESQFEFYIKNK